MPKSRKKTIVRRITQEWVAGYLPPEGFLQSNMVELLALDGKTVQIPVAELKWICYVRDFNSGEPANPERLIRKTFAGRPRSEGVLIRLRLSDGDVIEGLAANDLSLVSGEGLFLTPPDVRSNTQRIWVPAGAITEFQIVAVVGAKRKQATPAEAPQARQENLFP